MNWHRVRTMGTEGDPTMSKLLLIPVAAMALALGLATAAPAYADEDGYFVELYDGGIDGPADTALQIGYGVCQDLEDGVPRQATIDAIYESGDETFDYDDATAMYKAAIAHLC